MSMNKRIFIYCVGLMLPFLGACAGTPAQTASNSAEVPQEISKEIEQVRQSGSYVLQPGDLVEIKVFMEEDMDRTLRINGNGSITYPLVGTVQIAGYTLQQAEAHVGNALQTYLKNQQVSMLIKEYGNKTIYVLGQVKKPTSIEIPPEKPLTVLEAITSAGGFTDVAAVSKVRVLRMQDGKQNALDVDVTQITKQGNKAMDIALMPGDVVFVPQSLF